MDYTRKQLKLSWKHQPMTWEDTLAFISWELCSSQKINAESSPLEVKEALEGLLTIDISVPELS